MWSDNETNRDFLNFSSIADTIAEVIVQANGHPISIGVSGAWGTGKSSLITLINSSLRRRQRELDEHDFIFVKFNAWLYQGYDDARAALIDVIASTLDEEAAKREKGIDKARSLLKRVNWLRAAKLAGSAIPLLLGLPSSGLASGIYGLGLEALGIDRKEDAASGLPNHSQGSSPPKEIHALRQALVETLEAMNATLVVFIDDLDRCLPETTISTLEAIRLFLFLDNTAFVIAADDAMIKHAVRRHFEGLDDKQIVTNYFDKLIQVPIRVPPLGTQEVRAYMLLLFVDASGLAIDVKERFRKAVCNQLRQTWQGKQVDREFVLGLHDAIPSDLVSKFDLVDRLAPIMTSSSGIAGNPRLIKRFLNALSIRMSIARAHEVSVDEKALAKLMLFERLGDPLAYKEIVAEVGKSSDGKPSFLAPWEDKVSSGTSVEFSEPWKDPFVREWLLLPPRLADQDLRGAIYVSREYAPVITLDGQLSSDGAELLAALLAQPEMAAQLKERLGRLPKVDMNIVMERLLDAARKEKSWGVPPILDACLAVSEADPSQGARLAAFLQGRPASQIKPGIVPKIGDMPWAPGVFSSWESAEVSATVKKAIKEHR